MEVIEKIPRLSLLNKTNEFQVFEVTGEAGMQMPRHISTKEAIVIIREGAGLLKIDGKEQELKKGALITIPASKVHALYILKKFKANIIMAADSEIKFK